MLEALAQADAIVFAPSNPVVSIGPILGVPGIREAIEARRDVTVGVSGIIGGAPLAGMADRLMPATGLEVTAAGAASAYRGLLRGWLIDERTGVAPRIERDLGSGGDHRHDHGGRRRRRSRCPGNAEVAGDVSTEPALEIIGLEGIPEVVPGDDLVTILTPVLLRADAP